jgi:D-sedoheptulose 7-phosphate isomerase
MLDAIKKEFTKSRQVFENILADEKLLKNIAEVADAATKVLQNNKKIMFCGNGGSAADSQHLAAELVSKLNYDRPGLCAIALTVDTSALTAIGNDYGYEKAFSRQVEAVGQAGDMLFVFTTSGRSKNIIEAVKSAKAKNIKTVGFLGRDGRDVGALVDYKLNIPADETPNIQEGHISSGHIICGIIEENIYGSTHNPARKAKVKANA